MNYTVDGKPLAPAEIEIHRGALNAALSGILAMGGMPNEKEVEVEADMEREDQRALSAFLHADAMVRCYRRNTGGNP